jgi:tetratricopeptide (TPR) repeat protein
MLILRRLFLLAAAALLVWRIVALGLSAHYTEQPQAGPEAMSKALAWNPHQPTALYRQGLALREQDPGAAAGFLARAYSENPADVRPLVALAELRQTGGDQERSEALLETALRLAPADPWVHQQAAAYWVERGDLAAALRHWSAALEIDAALRSTLFPVLLRLAEDPRTRLALQPLAFAPPTWWPAFFTHVAAKASDADTLRTLYALRRESPEVPITEAERKTYVGRMMAADRIPEAYVDWVGGLDRQQRQQLGYLYNGGFELQPMNWGFGWRVRSTPEALIDLGTTHGVNGEQALRLIFQNHEGAFAGIAQTLFLDPGRYRLSGTGSTDNLESPGGIKWLVRCTRPEKNELGASERFLGANSWVEFEFEFDVPESCLLQELTLVSAGTSTFDQRLFSGGAWFDRLAIKKLGDRRGEVDTEVESQPDGG